MDYSGGGDDECGGRSSDELGDEAMETMELRAWLPRHLTRHGEHVGELGWRLR